VAIGCYVSFFIYILLLSEIDTPQLCGGHNKNTCFIYCFREASFRAVGLNCTKGKNKEIRHSRLDVDGGWLFFNVD
jgi:hypothetical protein